MAVSGATPSTASASAGQAVPAVPDLADLAGLRQRIAPTVAPATVVRADPTVLRQTAADRLPVIAPTVVRADLTDRPQEIGATAVQATVVRADLTGHAQTAADRDAARAAAGRLTSARLAAIRSTPSTG